jgi:hypothetical protein
MFGCESVAAGDEPAAIREHHRLRPIPGVDLREGSLDVRLGGRLGDDEPAGDLLIGPALTDKGEHLAFAVGEVAEGAVRGRVVAAAGEVLLDEVPGRAARPPATVRTTSSSRSGEARLSRNPLAPARRAPVTYSSSGNVVRIRILVGHPAEINRLLPRV